MHCNTDIIEYRNRTKMEETTGKVFARLHQMKSILCKTIKSMLRFILYTEVIFRMIFIDLETPRFCGVSRNYHHTSYCSPTNYYSMTTNDSKKYSEPTDISSTNVSICLKEKEKKTIKKFLFFHCFQ